MQKIGEMHALTPFEGSDVRPHYKGYRLGFEVYRKVYRKVYRDVITPERVAGLLMLRPDMPSRATPSARPAVCWRSCAMRASMKSSRPGCMPI